MYQRSALILLISSSAYAGKVTVSLTPSKKKPVIIKKLVTKSGKIYHNAEIDQCDPGGLAILHDAGCATIPLDDLPPDLRKKYADKVAAVQEAKQEAIDAIKRKQAEKIARTDLYMLPFYQREKSKQCFYCKGTGRTSYRKRVTGPHKMWTNITAYAQCTHCNGKGKMITPAELSIKKIRATPEGIIAILNGPGAPIDADLRITQKVSGGYLGVFEERSTIHAGDTYKTSIKDKRIKYGTTVFVEGIQDQLIDNSTYRKPIWDIAETYNYITILRAGRTVAKYTADPDVAAKKYKIAD